MTSEGSSAAGTMSLLTGVGLLAMSPLLMPGVAVVTRPVIKNLIKGSLAAADMAADVTAPAARWLEEVTAGTREQLDDLASEVIAEPVEFLGDAELAL